MLKFHSKPASTTCYNLVQGEIQILYIDATALCIELPPVKSVQTTGVFCKTCQPSGNTTKRPGLCDWCPGRAGDRTTWFTDELSHSAVRAIHREATNGGRSQGQVGRCKKGGIWSIFRVSYTLLLCTSDTKDCKMYWVITFCRIACMFLAELLGEGMVVDYSTKSESHIFWLSWLAMLPCQVSYQSNGASPNFSKASRSAGYLTQVGLRSWSSNNEALRSFAILPLLLSPLGGGAKWQSFVRRLGLAKQV